MLYFQRLSVIVTELLLLYGVLKFCSSAKIDRVAVAVAIVLGNVGLILVDHVHFQYNGMLLGLLVLIVDSAYRVSFIFRIFYPYV